MAASLDPITQAGIGAFAGLVEVTAQQVRRARASKEYRNLPRSVSERPPNRRFSLPRDARSRVIDREVPSASRAHPRRTIRRAVRVAPRDVFA